MSDERSASYCIECKQPLTEIDNRGKRLRGCMNCNIWWSLTDAKVRLSEEDLRALHALRRGKGAPTEADYIGYSPDCASALTQGESVKEAVER